ncbi:hypothetical protein [Bradyrhizobium iriomotense]|uniref:hypothetical protein n=1 Tax=Bradyrhizobium iriomotense TaxID=441950 RepID=UPI001B8A4477|nr:hypothetical protein [Bradyrhizobium iriomotense]MBR0782230.1 hypothetical protein [Bradyrhizobium iriomotense]
MITVLATRIILALALLVRRAADIMNCNLMVPLRPRHYLVKQRVAGIGRHRRRAFETGGRPA